MATRALFSLDRASNPISNTWDLGLGTWDLGMQISSGTVFYLGGIVYISIFMCFNTCWNQVLHSPPVPLLYVHSVGGTLHVIRLTRPTKIVNPLALLAVYYVHSLCALC